ncbi:unnamed protein product, partial [Ixodes hexagonus]
LCNTVHSRTPALEPKSPSCNYFALNILQAELYFRDLDCPKVQLYLVGLTNTTKEEEDNFEVTNIERPNIPHMDGPLTLALFHEWAEERKEFNDSDIVFLITSKHVVDYIGTYLFGLSGGVSYLDGICSDLHVGIVYDTGRNFFGIRDVAQLILPLLGAPWDEGHQAPRCLSSEGHLMSIRSSATLYPTLSNCTKEYLLQKYQDNLCTKPCWMDPPSPIIERTKNLSAQYFETENFCQARHPGYPEADYCPDGHPARNRTGLCRIACCKNITESFFMPDVLPDGTPCLEGKV